MPWRCTWNSHQLKLKVLQGWRQETVKTGARGLRSCIYLKWRYCWTKTPSKSCSSYRETLLFQDFLGWWTIVLHLDTYQLVASPVDCANASHETCLSFTLVYRVLALPSQDSTFKLLGDLSRRHWTQSWLAQTFWIFFLMLQSHVLMILENSGMHDSIFPFQAVFERGMKSDFRAVGEFAASIDQLVEVHWWWTSWSNAPRTIIIVVVMVVVVVPQRNWLFNSWRPAVWGSLRSWSLELNGNRSSASKLCSLETEQFGWIAVESIVTFLFGFWFLFPFSEHEMKW